MAKVRTTWRCQNCGASAPRWMGRCAECGEFGTYVEEAALSIPSSGPGTSIRPVALSEAGASETPRVATGVTELDQVLGGGLVGGSLVLLGGEPGIGKSTLLLQAAQSLGQSGLSVLYVCGEESPAQVGLRAQRLGARSGSVALLPELDMAALEQHVAAETPDILIIDSIQTVFDPELAGVPGSVGQVRACTARLMRIAKTRDVTTLIVGHVTKDGSIAGPRVLEHMVDAVLYFEGDRDHSFRIVRAVKNRFGSSSEIGIFEMSETGLIGVGSPSAALLSERGDAVPGSVVMPAMEGSRPLLVEIQALVTPSYLPTPRRSATGIDAARLLQVIAVLERRAGISFAGHDVLVSVAGGMRVVEPAADLPLALALASARKDVPVGLNLAAFGEVGLTGQVRPVAHASARLKEAERFGIDRVVAAVPAASAVTASSLLRVSTLKDAVDIAL